MAHNEPRRPPRRAETAPDLVEVELDLGGTSLSLLRPSDPTALLDEEAFAADEFLPYWAELWPSASVLVEALPEDLTGKRVLELGCGLGVPSLVAARRGASVVATDWAGDAVALLSDNARRNGLCIETLVADWRAPAPIFERAPFDLVIGADLCYEERNVEPLAGLIVELGSEVLLADPGRRHADALVAALHPRFVARRARAFVWRFVPRPLPLG